MVYLKEFELLDESQEHEIVCYKETRKIFNNYYPLKLFTTKEFKKILFDDITIFYGGNGSGKTTLINIISEKLHADRKMEVEKGSLFHSYVALCNYEINKNPSIVKLLTSDDIFEYLLDIRFINSGVNRNKEQLSQEYLHYKYNDQDVPFENYRDLKSNCDAKSKTMSRFIRERLMNNNIIEQSNGESALLFFEREIDENGIYILDEPENSLSVENQLKLKQFIEESVRFYHCQFIISTHSPFFLSLEGAKIYNLDTIPVSAEKWTELSNVKTYYTFFKQHEKEFEN